MLVYDITNPKVHNTQVDRSLDIDSQLSPLHSLFQSFDNLEHWRTDFLHNASPPDPDNFPFLVLGNKSDLESERKVPKQKAIQWTKSKGPKVCSR